MPLLPPGGTGLAASACLHPVVDGQHHDDDDDEDAQAECCDVQLPGSPPVGLGSSWVLGNFPISGLRMGRGRWVVKRHEPEAAAAMGRGDIPVSIAIERLASPKPGTGIQRALLRCQEIHPNVAGVERAAS